MDDADPVAATCGFSSQQREHLERYSTKPDRGSTFGRAIVEGRTVHIPDVIADPEWQRPEQPRATGIRAAVSVPLLGQGVILGVLTVIRTEPRAFTHKQIELLETFADQAVIAIENVRLFDEVQTRTRELPQSVDELRALGEVSQAVNSTLRPADRVGHHHRQGDPALRHRCRSYVRVRRGRSELPLCATYGMTAESIDVIKEHPCRSSRKQFATQRSGGQPVPGGRRTSTSVLTEAET